MHPIADHIKVVLFDFDDTLVGTIKPKWAQHKHVAKHYYDRDLTDEQIRSHWGKPFSEMLGLIHNTSDREQVMANTLACHEDFPKELFSDSIPLLHALKKDGKLLGVITATSRFSLEHDLQLHGFPRQLIDYLQTEEDTVYHKPDPRVFEPALTWLDARGIKPDEVLYVGDGLHDMKASLGVGFHFVGVETGLVNAQEFQTAKATSVPSVAHLLKHQG
jgi:phosphoglycolate phosphatase-like HAD superfamily hydrolase